MRTKTTIRKKVKLSKRTPHQKQYYAQDVTVFPKFSRNWDLLKIVPELGPIEDFWMEIKRIIYEKNFQAEHIDQLPIRIRYFYQNGQSLFTWNQKCIHFFLFHSKNILF